MAIKDLKSMAKESKIFSIDQMYQKTRIDKNTLKVMLTRLEKRGYIERIEKGKYMIIPFESEKGKYTLHEFVIGSYLVEPSAISYWSALNYYGMTEQIPKTVFLQTSARRKRSLINIFGVNYRIVRIKEKKIFGLRKEWIEETPINITDREKTIVDCLDKPRYSGGVIEIAKALKTNSLDYQRLSEYALRIGNYAVVRRLGYLSDQMGLKLPLEPPKSKKYLRLDPTMPPTGFNDPKWRLIVNLDTDFLRDLE